MNETHMTMTQKLLAHKIGVKKLEAGDLISLPLDVIMGNDITTPVAIGLFREYGFTKVFDPAKIMIVLDHFTPCKDIRSAEQCRVCRDFAAEQGVHLFDSPCGIEHAFLPEQGRVLPGDAIIGADSHTCTYGALGAFSTGVGSTDMAAAMATGKFWMKVPAGIEVILHGKLPRACSGKDVILHLLAMIGVDGALYRSLEFVGRGAGTLSMDDRFTIANMAVEAGAKNAMFRVDDVTMAYCRSRAKRPWMTILYDEYPRYERVIDIDLDQLTPLVACPHLPSNCRPASELGDVRLDQVVIGSCTNGRIGDMEIAASILKGRKVAKDLRCIIIPATKDVYAECLRRGYAEIFTDAGCILSMPTCGPCLGGYMGILAKGEVALSTTNRNFVGRMGDTGSLVYLGSPATAAASAVCGVITDPANWMPKEDGV